MTNLLLGAVLAVLVAVAAEAYVLIGRAQRLITHAEQLLAAAAPLVAALPGKSASRTVAPEGLKPRRWWTRLAALTDLAQAVTVAVPQPPGPDEVALDRWADDGGRARDVATPPPVLGPVTRPAPRIDLAGGLPTRRPRPSRPMDDVDRQLARFTFAGGRRP